MFWKLALFHVFGGMRTIKVKLFCSYFWRRQFVKTDGREKKKTAVVTLTSSRIFCGQRNLFLRSQHCICIALFIWNPGGPKLGAKKSLFRKQGCQFRTLAFHSVEIETVIMVTVVFSFFCLLVLVLDSA